VRVFISSTLGERAAARRAITWLHLAGPGWLSRSAGSEPM
jgi:hypothetical protein